MAWDDVLVAHVSKYTAAIHNEMVNQIKARIPHSLDTEANGILVGTGAGAFIFKTLAQFKVILGLGDAAYKNTGSSTGTLCAGDDSRLSNDRNPTAHKSTHATGGTDALSASDIGAEPANANIQGHIGSTSNPHAVTKTQVGLTNVDDVQQMPISYLDTDSTFAANSDSKIASQKAVKTAIDLKTAKAAEYTYAQLAALVSSSGLIPGQCYILTDYYTSYRQPTSNHYIKSYFIRTAGAVTGQAFTSSANATVAGCAGNDSYLSGLTAGTYGEKLILTAMSVNSFAPEAYSLDFKMDILEYQFGMNTREGDSQARPGLILRRKDTTNNIDIPGDWRTQVWARFKALKSSTDGGAETDRVRDWVSGTSEKGYYYWDAAETGNSGIKRIRCALKASASAWDYASFVTVIPNIDAYALAVNGLNNLKIDTSSCAYRYTFDGRWEKYDVTTTDGTYGDRDVNGQNCSVSTTPLCRVPNNPGRDITGGDPTLYIYNVFIDGGASDSRHNNVFYQETTRAGYNIAAKSGFYSNTFGSSCPNNTFGSNCYSNTFGSYCPDNTFGSSCYSNTFGSYCPNNTFGSSCPNNTFGSNCYSNTFGSYCPDNTFGSSCYSNTFGSYCPNNTFGSSCYSNTFDSYCYSNTFGSYCPNNTFGSSCYSNTFDSYCYSNTFGSSCYSNTFGSYCPNNTFGSNCYSNTTRGYTWQYVDARAGSLQTYTETANRSRATRTSAGAWA